MADSTPLEAPETSLNVAANPPTDVEMSNSAPSEAVQSLVSAPSPFPSLSEAQMRPKIELIQRAFQQQSDITPASPTTDAAPTTPAQLDGASDIPHFTNGTQFTNGNLPPQVTPQQYQQQSQQYAHQQPHQQQHFAQPYPPQSHPSSQQQQQHFTTPTHTHTHIAPASSTPQSISRQSQAPTAAATPSTGTQPNLPPSAIIPPANSHGSPTRVYINSKVTPALLEGMKRLAVEEPERPLRWLGEWLVRRSEGVEWL